MAASRFQRKSSGRLQLPKIYIFSNGDSTEPNYFNAKKNSIKSNSVEVVVNPGKTGGACTSGLLNGAEGYLKLNSSSYGEEGDKDEYWLVFDRDNFDDFDSTITNAQKKGFKVAFSNICFELWFFLHFDYNESALTAKVYEDKLSGYLGKKYSKTDRDIFSKIFGKENVALKNAKKLETIHSHTTPSKRDPSTTVYKLVDRLNALKTI